MRETVWAWERKHPGARAARLPTRRQARLALRHHALMLLHKVEHGAAAVRAHALMQARRARSQPTPKPFSA